MAKTVDEIAGLEAIEGSRKAEKKILENNEKQSDWPAEGPHARADLVNEAATPGTGLLSNPKPSDDEVDPGAG